MKRAKGTQNAESGSRFASLSQQQGSKQEQDQVVPKLQEHDPNDGYFECNKCSKEFSNDAQLYTHVRQKHPQEDLQSKSKCKKKTDFKKLESEQNDVEDNIYVFLGQLGQLHGEASDRNQSLTSNDDNKMIGHSNYCQNKVVRTPYQAQMQTQESMPDNDIQKSPYRDLLTTLKNQTIVLLQKIQQQREIWQFRDPMDPQSLADKQFSLMDIRKLIKNLPEKNLNITRPHFSIFILWVSRICKPLAWKQFFILLGTYIAIYQKLKGNQGQSNNPKKRWSQFINNYKQQYGKQLFKDLVICNEKQGPQVLQHYANWVEAFELIPEQ